MKGKAQTMTVAGSPGLSFFHSTQFFDCETLVPVFKRDSGERSLLTSDSSSPWLFQGTRWIYLDGGNDGRSEDSSDL